MRQFALFIFWVLLAPTKAMAEPQTKEVVFIRHAQSEFNVSRRRQLVTTVDSLFKMGLSHKDTELTDAGIVQVLSLRKHPVITDLVNDANVVYLTSRLHRALNTTLLLAHGTKRNPHAKIFLTDALLELPHKILGRKIILTESTPLLPYGSLPKLRKGIAGFDILAPHYDILPELVEEIGPAIVDPNFNTKLKIFVSQLFDNEHPSLKVAKRMVVVGHSQWLEHFFASFYPNSNMARVKMNNCQIIRTKLTRMDNGKIHGTLVLPTQNDVLTN